jgi:hypothetical protein
MQNIKLFLILNKMPYTLRPFPANIFNSRDFSELQKFKKAWMTFEKIYAIQVLAREDRVDNGIYDANLPYQYASFEEKNLVLLGQQLHLKAYPPQAIDPFSTETETWNLL